MRSLATHSRNVGARDSLKRATKGFKAKMEYCDQNVGNVLDQVGITIPCSPRLFL